MIDRVQIFVGHVGRSLVPLKGRRLGTMTSYRTTRTIKVMRNRGSISKVDEVGGRLVENKHVAS